MNEKNMRTHLHLWNVVQANPHLLRAGNDIHQTAHSLQSALISKAETIFGNKKTHVMVTMQTEKTGSRTWEILVVFPSGAVNEDMVQVAGFLTTQLETMGVAGHMGKRRFDAIHKCQTWKEMEDSKNRQKNHSARTQAEALFKKGS